MQIYIQNELDIKKPLDHDYDLEETFDKKLLVLNRSYASDWSPSSQGQSVANLEDTGDGVKISIDDQEIELDYAQARELLILLVAANEDKIEFRESRVIKTI